MITRLRKKGEEGEEAKAQECNPLSQMSYHTRVSLAKGVLHLG